MATEQQLQDSRVALHRLSSETDERLARMMVWQREMAEVILGYRNQHDRQSGNWECGCHLCDRGTKLLAWTEYWKK